MDKPHSEDDSEVVDERQAKHVLGVTVRTTGKREAVLIIDADIVRRDGTMWTLGGRAVTAEIPLDDFVPIELDEP